MQFNFIPDASALANAPAAAFDAMSYEAQVLSLEYPGAGTVNIQWGWGQNNGQAVTSTAIAMGGPTSPNAQYWTYAQVRQQMQTLAAQPGASPALVSFAASLPVNNPLSIDTYYITSAQLKAWGLVAPNATQIDGTIGFNVNTSWNFDASGFGATPGQYDFQATVGAEVAHVLGKWSNFGLANNDLASIEDLARYSAPGVIATDPTTPAYLSVNGGVTNLATFQNASGDPSDLALSTDQFGYGNAGTVGNYTATDQNLMAMLGIPIQNSTVPTDVVPANQVINGDNGDNVNFIATIPPAALGPTPVLQFLDSGNAVNGYTGVTVSDPVTASGAVDLSNRPVGAVLVLAGDDNMLVQAARTNVGLLIQGVDTASIFDQGGSGVSNFGVINLQNQGYTSVSQAYAALTPGSGGWQTLVTPAGSHLSFLGTPNLMISNAPS